MNHTKLQSMARNICAVACVAAVISGCATTPMPTDRIALARSAIERAQRVDADELAPVQLRAAREKLTAAEASPHTSTGAIVAGRLAAEAEIDARVAEASARAARSERAAAEQDRNLDALRTEANHNAANN
jgi:hypothetical protein